MTKKISENKKAQELRTSALDSILTYYRDFADQYLSKTRNLDFSTDQADFSELLPVKSLILDAGCGSGRDSIALANLGHTVVAIDASPAMVEEAKSKGVNASVMTFQDMEWSDQFDGIWALASLLHVPKSEISNVLLRLWEAAKNDATLFVSLKAGSGERFAEDGRFFAYYTYAEFYSLLEEEGRWDIIKSEKQHSKDGIDWLRIWARANKSK